MIVLTKEQRDFFNNFKLNYEDILSSRNVNIVPIEIKNNLWILPEDVLTDDRYIEMRLALESTGALNEIIFREVSEDEFIKLDI